MGSAMGRPEAKALEAIRRAQLEQAGRWERCRGSRGVGGARPICGDMRFSFQT